MLKTITTTLAAAAVMTVGLPAAAQGDYNGQPPSPPQVAPQSAGGFGTTNMWGYVSAAGTHVSGTGGSNLANTAKIGTGTYEVIFKRGIAKNCYFGGTMANQGFGQSPGFIDVVLRGGNTKGVFVQTFDAAGASADRSFLVYVYCYR